MEKINIEAIMEEIRADIRERGLEDKEIPFEDIVLLGGGTGAPYSADAYRDMLSAVGETSEVLSYRELAGNPISKIIKKINRRLIAFYIESIVDDQNKFNRNIYKGMTMNLCRFKEDEERFKAMEQKLYDCERRIHELEQQLAQK